MSQEEPGWVPLDEIAEQERALVLTRFTNDDAWELGSLLVSLARQRSLPVVVRISRGDQVLFHAAMPGTSPDNDSWVERKTRVVLRFGHSSLFVGQQARDAETSFEDRHGLPRDSYAAHGGGFPITVRDVGVVGAVVVSGLPQLADHALVVEALRTYLQRETSPAAP
ncbi:MAG TPA: heme-degrading domain-containing protein [Actinomycetes bacterium]|nr:heme-degrading domain-containing protein [Actinomycetes bacterium]